MDSIISGYAFNEGPWFTDKTIDSTEKFDAYVRKSFGNHTGMGALFERAKQLYPAAEVQGSPFRSTQDRLGLYVGDAGFNCHHRMLAQAYQDRAYTYQSSLFGGGHYVDQFLSFFDSEGRRYIGYSSSTKIGLGAFMSYLISEIVSGDPNTLRNEATIEWPLTTGFEGKTLSGVLNWTGAYGPDGFSIIPSPRLVKERCDFWNEVWSSMEKGFSGSA
jgi:hypothetical protein